MSQFSFTRNLSPAATCCHLQFCGRTWLSGRTCAPELVASWRRGVVHVETAPMGGRGHEIPHSSALSIHQHPVYSSTREVCPSSKESYILSYMFCLFLCQFVWTIWTSTSWWIKCARWWNWTAQDLPKSQHMDVMDVMDVMDRKVPWNSTEPREVPC